MIIKLICIKTTELCSADNESYTLIKGKFYNVMEEFDKSSTQKHIISIHPKPFGLYSNVFNIDFNLEEVLISNSEWRKEKIKKLLSE